VTGPLSLGHIHKSLPQRNRKDIHKTEENVNRKRWLCWLAFVNREVSHKYANDNDNEHVIAVWVRPSSRVISFRKVRDVSNEHDLVELLRYVGIFRLQMLNLPMRGSALFGDVWRVANAISFDYLKKN
jgi:hypothetical protein